ncbi:hypothetical protein U91I_02997 [alpha proteobacterium U9-1i]|nr:hypothetical protein U91I_02997 [alpha proteobacterium U9-1i]
MKQTFVLIHNPLFGPSTLAPTAEALKQKGHAASAPALAPAFAGGGPYYPKAAQIIADAGNSASEGVFLVAHGAAGPLVAAAAAASKAPVLGVILLSAIMPHANRAWLDTVPDEIKAQFAAIAKNGRLPANDKMYPGQADALRQQVGNPGVYTKLAAELIELPLAYFEEAAPPNDAIKKTPIGYIQLSAADQPRFDDATWMKWKTRQEISADGFPTITKPERVAAAIEAMAKDLRA